MLGDGEEERQLQRQVHGDGEADGGEDRGGDGPAGVAGLAREVQRRLEAVDGVDDAAAGQRGQTGDIAVRCEAAVVRQPPECQPEAISATTVITGTRILNTEIRLLSWANIRTANQFSTVSTTLSPVARASPARVRVWPL